MRKAVAGALIKLAHRVYPPHVTPYSAEDALDRVGHRIERVIGNAMGGQIADLSSHERAERLESRGWN